jgi:hypothetical protein
VAVATGYSLYFLKYKRQEYYTMKNYIKILIALLVTALTFSGCDENDVNTPSPATSGNNITANFAFINAVADGGSLSLLVNGVSGPALDIASGQNGYTPVGIQTGFATTTTNLIANTAIRAVSTSGTIGGALGSNPIIYRGGNTNANNLVAAANALYTVIALDSINRPRPLRTLSVIDPVTNALAADITYYNRANGTQISNDQFRALPTQAERDRCVSLGIIPSGTTDPGGPRFLLLTDTYPTFAAGNSTQSGIRFINAVPNSYDLPTETRIFARLNAGGSQIITLTPIVTTPPPPTNVPAEYIMSVRGGFSPSAGSRTTTVPFTLQSTAIAGSATVYTLELSTNSNFATIAYSLSNQTFAVGKVYTIVARGIVGKTGSSGLSAIVVQHN